jgi:hypothetical protein
VTAPLAARLAARSPRERALLAGALVAAALGGGLAAVLAIHADIRALQALVATRERELVTLRRLAAAAALAPGGGTPAGAGTGTPLGEGPGGWGPRGPSLVTRLETAAAAVVGRPRIAAMTPTTTPLPEGLREERVAVRLAGVSLGELVRLLHGLGSAEPPITVARLELRKHPDDPRHFDATVDAAEVVPAAAP